MSVERNRQALIDLVERAAASRRAELMGAARVQASMLLRDAHAAARHRVHCAFDNERRRARDQVAAARAMLETRRRLALQRHNAALLATGWQALPDALVERWHRQPARATWLASALAVALRALPKGGWRIVHPPAWPVAERQTLVDAIAQATGEPPSLEEDSALRAGLAIVAGGTTIDATLAGLLADRQGIGACLLQRLEEQDSAAQGPPA